MAQLSQLSSLEQAPLIGHGSNRSSALRPAGGKGTGRGAQQPAGGYGSGERIDMLDHDGRSGLEKRMNEIDTIAGAPTGRALIEAARARRVGAPLYLRYAAEAGSAGDLLRQAACALDFAVQVLGEAVDVYAAGVSGPTAELAHLALTVRHRDGSVALLGIGAGQPRADSGPLPPPRPEPPSLLLLGDQGAVERYPGTAGPDMGPGVAPAGDTLERYAAAVRRSLASGRPEVIAGHE